MTTPGNPAAHDTDLVITGADEADAGVLSQVIADAFAGLAPCRWLVADPGARRSIFPGYFRMYVEHALQDGVVETTPDRTAAALWVSGTGPADPPDGYAGQLAAITGPWLDRFLAFDAELDRHHPRGTFHHHLAILAVRPDKQGQGTGTALLHAHHARLDDKGIPAYLEAADERTRRIYLAHGYADLGSPIQLPGGPAMYPMFRPPRPAIRGEPADRKADRM
jgi:GNAT superfamily N-acetyltransferase